MTTVEYESVAEGVALITLNRPERLNAFNAVMLSELKDVLCRFDQDESVNVAVLTGRGRAFSSGADIKELAEVGSLADSQSIRSLLLTGTNWKPVVSAVHGYVVGMALEIACQSELVIASDSTKFQVSETNIGVSTGAMWPIIQFRTGAAFASDVCVTGRFFDAEEALRHNMITAVLEGEGYLSNAVDRARSIAQLPQASVRQVVRVARWYLEKHRQDSVPFFEMTRKLTSASTFTRHLEQLTRRGRAPE